MSERQGSKSPDIYQTNRFRNAYKKMSLSQQRAVDDVIDDIADDPEIGEQKQGDLSHLRVYKFRISKMEYLLGYHWDDSRIVINLLQLGSHENYYADAKKAARVDKKFIAD